MLIIINYFRCLITLLIIIYNKKKQIDNDGSSIISCIFFLSSATSSFQEASDSYKRCYDFVLVRIRRLFPLAGWWPNRVGSSLSRRECRYQIRVTFQSGCRQSKGFRQQKGTGHQDLQCKSSIRGRVLLI